MSKMKLQITQDAVITTSNSGLFFFSFCSLVVHYLLSSLTCSEMHTGFSNLPQKKITCILGLLLHLVFTTVIIVSKSIICLIKKEAKETYDPRNYLPEQESKFISRFIKPLFLYFSLIPRYVPELVLHHI
jgi:hypothetical protein